MRMERICIILLLPVFFWACTATTQKNIPYSRLESENYILKKRVIFIQRKNSIVEEENIGYKKDIKNRDAKVENLQSQISSLSKKYKKDIKLRQNKYDNIVKKNIILEKMSSEKIRGLTQLNKKLERNLGGQIAKLNEEIKRKENLFSETQAKNKRGWAEKEFKLLKTIELLKQDGINKDEKRLSLEQIITKNNKEIKKLQDDIIEKTGTIDKKTKKVEELKKRDGELQSAFTADKKKTAEKNKEIKELQKEIVKLKKEMDEKNSTIKELESKVSQIEKEKK